MNPGIASLSCKKITIYQLVSILNTKLFYSNWNSVFTTFYSAGLLGMRLTVSNVLIVSTNGILCVNIWPEGRNPGQNVFYLNV